MRQFLSERSDLEREQWTCDKCIEKNLYPKRNCPLDLSYLSVQQEEETPKSNPAAAAAKYGFGNNLKKKREAQQEAVSSQDASASPQQEEDLDEDGAKRLVILKHGDFKFYECPVPMLDERLMTSEERFANFLSQIVEWSEATGQLPVPGGLLYQSNVYFESRMIILSEKNKIEYEKQKAEEQKREADRSKSKAQGARKRMGR